MKFTIEPITERTFQDKQTSEKVTMPGFAFMDECNCCIIIVYGIGMRNKVDKILKK